MAVSQDFNGVVGYVVLTNDLNHRWHDDWDGVVHPTRAEGEAELLRAAATLGADGVALGEVKISQGARK